MMWRAGSGAPDWQNGAARRVTSAPPGAMPRPPRTVFELFMRTSFWLARFGGYSYAAELHGDLPPYQEIVGIFDLADRCVRLPMTAIERLQTLLDRCAEGVILPPDALGLELEGLRSLLHEMWHAQGPGNLGAMCDDEATLRVDWGKQFCEGLTHHATLVTERAWLEDLGLAAAQPGLLEARPAFVYYPAQAAAVEMLVAGLMVPLGGDLRLVAPTLASAGYAELPLRVLTTRLVQAWCSPPRFAGEARRDAGRLAAAIRGGFDALAREIRTALIDSTELERIGRDRGSAIVTAVTNDLRQLARRRPPAAPAVRPARSTLE